MVRRLLTSIWFVAFVVTLPVRPPMVAAQEGDGGWLALGDSYSSGEGIPGTPPREAEGSGFATQGRDCRRATGEGTGAMAWSVGAFRSVQSDLGLSEIALVACTKAVTGEFDDQIGEARARFGGDRWKIVTFSIGGNDIRFAEVLEGCLDINSFWGVFDLTPGCDISEAELRTRVDGLRRTLGGVYDSVAEVVEPGGDVIVAGYPQLIEEVAHWERWRRNVIGNCEGIQSYDVGMLRSVAGYLNQQIALAAQDADARHRNRGVRFHFLDISTDPYEYSDRSTDRHALCADDPWLNGQTIGIGSGDFWELDRSFHPHQEGHTNTARVLATFINEHITLDDTPNLDISALASAEVPSLCGHPPGRLVDGELPGIPEINGFVSLDLSDRVPVSADFDSDGVTEIVAIGDCSQGGVGWPNSLLLYGPGPRLLDEFNMEQIVDRGLEDYAGDRSGARSMDERDGRLRVAWLVHRDGDFGAGPTLPVEVTLDILDDEFTVVDVTRRDERSMLEAVITAANAADRSALDRHELGQYVAEDLISAVEVGGEFTGFDCAGGTDNLDYDWVRQDASRSCQLTQSGGYVSWAYFTLNFEPGNAFRSTWRLDVFDAPILYGD